MQTLTSVQEALLEVESAPWCPVRLNIPPHTFTCFSGKLHPCKEGSQDLIEIWQLHAAYSMMYSRHLCSIYSYRLPTMTDLITLQYWFGTDCQLLVVLPRSRMIWRMRILRGCTLLISHGVSNFAEVSFPVLQNYISLLDSLAIQQTPHSRAANATEMSTRIAGGGDIPVLPQHTPYEVLTMTVTAHGCGKALRFCINL